MSRFLTLILSLFVLAVLTLGAGGVWLARETKKPGPFAVPQEATIKPGTSGRAIAQQLEDRKLISEADLFYALLRLSSISVKAGEYEIPVRASMNDILTMLREGKTVQRSFTLAEGLTVKQAMILLNQNSYLTGEVKTPEEGTLLPETYNFTRGDTRENLIRRMQESQKKLLEELWEKRADNLPLKNRREAVTLASIVEKETGKPSERARIAGLFYNRLKIGMPLQTDPTVVYAITDGLGHMGGKRLYSKYLATDSPYNTYKHAGLTPGPIANPGKASLEAVLHPEENDYLYFVADGTGGHVFSTDLKGHEENVREWREIRKRRETQ